MTTTHPDLQFGALAVQNGFASPSEVELALEAQKEGPAFEGEKTPQRLGEILVEMGTLTPEQIQTVLDAQSKLRQAEGEADPLGSTTQMPVTFEEISGPALVQEAGPAIAVNGEPITQPRTLKPGDRLKVGDALFQVSGEALEIRPTVAPAPAAAEATPPRPSFVSRLLPVLRAVDGLIARLLPAIHTQRKYVIAAAALAALAFLLPWRIASNGNSVLGIQGPGWLPFLLALVPAALTLLTRSSEPFTRAERIVSSAAAGLALLILILKFLFPPSYATARGFGLYLSILSTLALLAAGAFPRAGGSGAAGDSTTLGGRLWKKLSGFLGTISGRRARDLNAALEQRDALLRTLGEAALEAHPTLPEAAAALQARVALKPAEADAGTNVKAKAAQKAADAKAKRAFAKLAQKALDDGLSLPGQEATIADLRAIEAKIKELS